MIIKIFLVLLSIININFIKGGLLNLFGCSDGYSGENCDGIRIIYINIQIL